MGLERRRLISRAVIDELGARAESRRIEFTSAVVARDHHKCFLAGRRVLRHRRDTGVVRPDESKGGQGLNGGERLSRGDVLEGRAGWDGSVRYCVYRVAVPPVQNVILPVLAAVAERLEVPSASSERKQHCRLRAVVVPDVVVNCLETPHGPAGPQAESEDRGGKVIIAGPIFS